MSLYIYDENINSFITLMKMELNRLSDLTGSYYVRHLPILVADDTTRLGYYDPNQNCIVLNKKLIYCAKIEVAKQILGHEVAHYLTIYHHGLVQDHGKEYKAICQKYNLFAPAGTNINKLNANYTDEKETELIEKIKKLLRLASSDNENESKLATAKANQLLMKYNLTLTNAKDSSRVYMKKLGNFKRHEAKTASIAKILGRFNVFVVSCSGYDNNRKRFSHLQISGNKANVDIAEYVYDFLDSEFDRLWNKAKKQHNLKGVRARNSYFVGLASGFINKLDQSKPLYTEEENNALVVIHRNAEAVSKRYIYKRLTYSYSNRRRDDYSETAGYNDGKKLSINKGVTGTNKRLLLS